MSVEHDNQPELQSSQIQEAPQQESIAVRLDKFLQEKGVTEPDEELYRNFINLIASEQHYDEIYVQAFLEQEFGEERSQTQFTKDDVLAGCHRLEEVMQQQNNAKEREGQEEEDGKNSLDIVQVQQKQDQVQEEKQGEAENQSQTQVKDEEENQNTPPRTQSKQAQPEEQVDLFWEQNQHKFDEELQRYANHSLSCEQARVFIEQNIAAVENSSERGGWRQALRGKKLEENLNTFFTQRNYQNMCLEDLKQFLLFLCNRYGTASVRDSKELSDSQTIDAAQTNRNKTPNIKQNRTLDSDRQVTGTPPITQQQKTVSIEGKLLKTIAKYETMLAESSDDTEKRVLIQTLDALKAQLKVLKLGKERQSKISIQPKNYSQQTIEQPSPTRRGQAEQKRHAQLREVFDFYCKQQYTEGVNSTFERIQHECSSMNIGKFFAVCKEFNLMSADPRLSREELLEIFKKNAHYAKEATIEDFVKIILKIVDRLYGEENSDRLELFFSRLAPSDSPSRSLKRRLRFIHLPFNTKEKPLLPSSSSPPLPGVQNSGSQQRQVRPSQNFSEMSSQQPSRNRYRVQGVTGKTADEVQEEIQRRKQQRRDARTLLVNSIAPSSSNNAAMFQASQNQVSRQRVQLYDKPENFSGQYIMLRKQKNPPTLNKNVITWDLLENLNHKDISMLVNEEGEENFDPRQLFNSEENSNLEEEQKLMLRDYQLSDNRSGAKIKKNRVSSDERLQAQNDFRRDNKQIYASQIVSHDLSTANNLTQQSPSRLLSKKTTVDNVASDATQKHNQSLILQQSAAPSVKTIARSKQQGTLLRQLQSAVHGSLARATQLPRQTQQGAAATQQYYSGSTQLPAATVLDQAMLKSKLALRSKVQPIEMPPYHQNNSNAIASSHSNDSQLNSHRIVRGLSHQPQLEQQYQQMNRELLQLQQQIQRQQAQLASVAPTAAAGNTGNQLQRRAGPVSLSPHSVPQSILPEHAYLSRVRAKGVSPISVSANVVERAQQIQNAQNAKNKQVISHLDQNNRIKFQQGIGAVQRL